MNLGLPIQFICTVTKIYKTKYFETLYWYLNNSLIGKLMKKMLKIVASILVVCSIANAKTLVTVNGTAITQNDVDTALMNATQGRFNQVPPEKQAQFRKQVLEQLIAKELAYGDAKKTGVLKSKEFKAEYEKVIQRVKKELAVQVWQKKELDKVKVSSKELKDYYNKNKEEFSPGNINCIFSLIISAAKNCCPSKV